MIHNHEVESSSLSPATSKRRNEFVSPFFVSGEPPTIFTFPPNLPLAKGGFATQNNPVTHKGMMFCATFKSLSRYKKGVISITPFFVAERDKCVTHPLNPPPVRGTLLRRTNRSKLYTTESPYKKKRVDYNRNRELAPNILASECGRYNAQ